jgi:hypothetical protein
MMGWLIDRDRLIEQHRSSFGKLLQVISVELWVFLVLFLLVRAVREEKSPCLYDT